MRSAEVSKHRPIQLIFIGAQGIYEEAILEKSITGDIEEFNDNMNFCFRIINEMCYLAKSMYGESISPDFAWEFLEYTYKEYLLEIKPEYYGKCIEEKIKEVLDGV